MQLTRPRVIVVSNTWATDQSTLPNITSKSIHSLVAKNKGKVVLPVLQPLQTSPWQKNSRRGGGGQNGFL